MTSPTATGNDRMGASLAVVCWRGTGGGLIRSYPLARPLAQAVSRAFAAIYPKVGFWVEDIPWIASGAGAASRDGHRRATAPAAPVPGASAPPPTV